MFLIVINSAHELSYLANIKVVCTAGSQVAHICLQSYANLKHNGALQDMEDVRATACMGLTEPFAIAR